MTPAIVNEIRLLQGSKDSGGETGIRTLGARKGSTVFETAPFDHSGTSPTLISLYFSELSRKR